MLTFRDEDEVLDESLREKDEKIKQLESELMKYKSKANLINQVNSIVNRSAVSDDLYKTLFLYIVEMMDEMNKYSSIPVNFIKEYMENLLEDVDVEIFIGETLYGELYGNSSDEIEHKDLHALYNLSTTNELNIEKILNAVQYKNDLVEISNIKLNEIGLGQFKGGAVWVMEPLLDINPGFIVFLLNGEHTKYLTPIEKEIISVFIKVLLPMIYSKILMNRIAEEAIQAAKSALTDPLTGMNNRKSFNEDFSDNQKVGTEDHILMFMDLCKFKRINDTYGHDVADGVLIEFGKQLQAFVSQLNGKSYRLGGDEFVATIPSNTPIEVIKRKTQQFKDIWCETEFNSEIGKFKSNVSIGVYKNENSVSTKSEMVKRADDLMYRSKDDVENYEIVYNF